MKKNRMMRLASGLLVAVLVTTSMISGTFAKYTTQDSGYDVARVAKWGVELQVVGNLYGDTYKEATYDADGNLTAGNMITNDSTEISVQAANVIANTQGSGDDVVAPGTKNDDGFTFSLKGTPEVTSKVTAEIKAQNIFLKKGTYGVMVPVDEGIVTEEIFDEFENLYTKTSDGDNTVYKLASAWSDTGYYTLEDYVVNNVEFYYPVLYKLDGLTKYSQGVSVNVDSINKIAETIVNRFGVTEDEIYKNTDKSQVTTYRVSQTYEPNTKLDALNQLGLADQVITWEWAFDRDSTKAEGDSANVYNKADTILGMIENTTKGDVVKLSAGNYVPVVKYTDYCLDTQFSIDITVTQVD